MKADGTLRYDAHRDRMDIVFPRGNYGGLHCGECFEVLVNGEWVPTRIEMSNEWFLVGTGLKGVGCLSGLKVRI